MTTDTIPEARRPRLNIASPLLPHDAERARQLVEQYTYADLATGCHVWRRRLRGESHQCAKLTAEAVKEIKAKAHLNFNHLAKCYGVSYGAIYKILKGMSWKHIA